MNETHIQTADVTGIEEAGKVEISVKRVAVWTLIFTNAFFICYFFGKLFALV